MHKQEERKRVDNALSIMFGGFLHVTGPIVMNPHLTDSEKLLLSKVNEVQNFTDQFEHCKTTTNMSLDLGWHIKKCEKILQDLKNKKYVTEEGKVNYDKLAEEL